MAYDDQDTPAASDDMYGDGTDKAADAPKPEMDEDKGGDETEAILPKSILAGKHFDVGDELTVVVKAIHDDQISVAYAPAKKDGDKPADVEKPAAVPAGMGSDSEGDY